MSFCLFKSICCHQARVSITPSHFRPSMVQCALSQITASLRANQCILAIKRVTTSLKIEYSSTIDTLPRLNKHSPVVKSFSVVVMDHVSFRLSFSLMNVLAMKKACIHGKRCNRSWTAGGAQGRTSQARRACRYKAAI